ncbi:heme biosynthesis operon protein HemX [Enterovibrio norvegicus]|uniref:uroporphyrinogen-III C-methyltransferase n=1 Tax=Enterovibrio norvegicus TaxID=188144 RepID=UPI0002E2CB09|nr:uroporphyrinogen-III C-methyltransferase [Enterovibrio norvegicus]OEF49146.1 heme biosynthesis operon protein HemX [Enterovibrio norvegicus]
MTDKNKTSGTDKNTSAPASSSGKETPSSSNTAASSQPSNSKPSNAEKKTASTPPEAKPAKEQKRGGNKLAAVAIILVIALGAGLYYHGHQQSQQYNADISALASQVDALKSALSDSEKQNQAALASAAQNTQVLIKQQDKTIVSLQSALADMKGRRPNDWLLAEAEYLVNQAGRQLWLVHDVLTATTLMENADQRIAELNDPSMTPIRQAMAKDIMQLKALKRIDRDGLVLRLNSLQQEVDTLPLANAIMPQAEEVAPEKVSSDVSDWEQNLKASMNDFVGKFITYRKREGDVVPLLTPAQTFYLQENLKAKLDQAITAVYRENGRLYAKSLSTAKAWAERFYNQDAKSTEAFITTLTHLSEQTISVNYPEVLHSQDLISEALSERLRRDLSPLPAEAEALPTEESTQ